MEKLWNELTISSRLMVSDFSNLHCEGGCSVTVAADDIRPGFVVPDLYNYCYGVKVVRTAPTWVQLEIGDKLVTVLSGSTVSGPDKPLSYAYGTMSLTLKGEKIPALKLYDEVCDSKAAPARCRECYDRLVATAGEDAWAAYFAVEEISMLRDVEAVERGRIIRRLSELLYHHVTQGDELSPKEQDVWRKIGMLSGDYYYEALNMRYYAESFIHSDSKGSNKAYKAMVAASYTGDPHLIEPIMPYLSDCHLGLARIMSLRYRQMHNLPYLDDLRRMMDEGLWQAHFMFLMTFMPLPLPICDPVPDMPAGCSLESSIVYLTEYYATNERNDFTTVEGLNAANFCRYCMSGGAEGASPREVEKMRRGSYSGLAFSSTFYGIVSCDRASGPRELNEALEYMQSGARHPFIWPKRAYLAQLTKYDVDPDEQHLLIQALGAMDTR